VGEQGRGGQGSRGAGERGSGGVGEWGSGGVGVSKYLPWVKAEGVYRFNPGEGRGVDRELGTGSLLPREL
jgi:hypothetical protein